MGFIATIGFKPVSSFEGKFQSFGRVWHGGEGNDKARVYLHGFRFGDFIAKCYDSIHNPPYIEGEIVAILNARDDRKDPIWQWCGFINTTQNEDGNKTFYTGRLEVLPFKHISTWNKGYFLLVQQGSDNEQKENG